jgi:hypothetical protein
MLPNDLKLCAVYLAAIGCGLAVGYALASPAAGLVTANAVWYLTIYKLRDTLLVY